MTSLLTMMIVAIVAVPYSPLIYPRKVVIAHIFFEADQVKPLPNMSFNLLVTPSGLLLNVLQSSKQVKLEHLAECFPPPLLLKVGVGNYKSF
jgi:hypothetical protein